MQTFSWFLDHHRRPAQRTFSPTTHHARCDGHTADRAPGAWRAIEHGRQPLSGLIGAYTLTMHPGTDVEILISCCVMGYIAGISSRNAAARS